MLVGGSLGQFPSKEEFSMEIILTTPLCACTDFVKYCVGGDWNWF